MDFEFSADQEMLRESVRRFLADKAPIAYVRAALRRRRADRSATTTCGPASRELGVVGLLVPEEHGGAGMGMVDAAVVLEELGRAVLPGAVRVVGDRRGVARARRGRAARAQVPAARPRRRLDDRHASRSSKPGARYRVARRRRPRRAPTATAWRLDGAKVHVADGSAADVFLVTARDRRRRARRVRGAARRRRRAASSRRRPSTARRKQATVDVRRRAAAGGSAPATPTTRSRARSTGSASRHVVDGVGAAARALELAVEYAKERVQFDKPIGSFQAVQHLCADMLRARRARPGRRLLRVLGRRRRRARRRRTAPR